MAIGHVKVDVTNTEQYRRALGLLERSVAAAEKWKRQAIQAEQQADRMRNALRSLLSLVHHTTDLPHSAKNDVERNGINEGEARAEQIIEEAEQAAG